MVLCDVRYADSMWCGTHTVYAASVWSARSRYCQSLCCRMSCGTAIAYGVVPHRYGRRSFGTILAYSNVWCAILDWRIPLR
eukprot:3941748-Rhodomonas_salina.1